MKRLKQIAFALLFLFIGIQFVRPARNENEQAVDISNMYSMPDTVRALFRSACFDCHSDNTEYPWYSNVQPVGWLLARDVNNGKAKLNFSEFASLTSRKQATKLQEVANRIKDGTMPLSAYKLMHQNARLTAGQSTLLLNWIQETKDSIALKRLMK